MVINDFSCLDFDFWLQEMETKLASGELGKDLASVETLLKKHQHIEAEIKAYEVFILNPF